jgi:Right handed beta helix region
MRSARFRILLVGVMAMLAASSMAYAQATRTWVSGVGDDANPCSRTAPCKTFAGAISKTAPGGEIDVLDPGGFGALTITKAISIESDGVIAGVLVSGTNGFVIAAGASDNVVLKGLTFEGLGTGLNGVSVLSAGNVVIENCTINNFVNQGVSITPGSPSTSVNVSIKDTNIRNNAAAAPNGFGVYVKPATGVAVDVVLDNVRSENNSGGLRVEAGRVAARNSLFANNKANGVIATATGTTAVDLSLEQSMVFANGNDGVVGQSPGGGACSVRLSNTSIFDNTVNGVVQTSPCVVTSFINNRLFGNGTPVSGSLTTQSQQ